MPAPDDRDVLAGLRARIDVPPVDGIVRRGKRRRRRRRSAAVAAGVLVVVAAGLGTTAVDRDGDSEQVAVGAAGDAHAELERILRDDGNPPFPSDPIGGEGRLACVDGQEVRVFDFGSAEEAQRASDAIDRDDPSNLGSAIVSWSGTPRMWVDEELLVMYSGPDNAVVATLERAFGAPFAVGQGRQTDAAAFSCDGGTAAATPPEPDETEPRRVVQAFLAAVAAGDVEGAGRFVDEYALALSDGGIEGVASSYEWLVAADSPEVFVTPTAVTDADTELVDVTLAVHAPDGSTGDAAAFVVGRAASGEATILRLPAAAPASEPAEGTLVGTGDRIVLPGVVPVEGGAVAHVNGEQTSVEVLYEEEIAVVVSIDGAVVDHAVVTVSVATPEYPGALALYFAAR